MIVKYKIKCTTCDSTATVPDNGNIPIGWARDHSGDIHCLKCWKIAKAMIKTRDSRNGE